jgi:NAD(P)-dependent dehydrogenase (short-subunit alcohol dehydrogenase family)
MSTLKGKVAVVTGGNSGIGLSTAQAFINDGAKVVIFGREQVTLNAAVETLGSSASGVQGDVTSADDLAKLYAHVQKRHGSIDILFVNAGVAEFRPFEMSDAGHFDKLFDINVKGAYFTIQTLLPLFKQGGSIILTTSGANETGYPNMSVYAATKAALRSLARTLSAELVGRGIRVNAVSPGPIATPIMGRSGLTPEQVEGFGKMLIEQVPLKRVGQPSEIASAVRFLAGTESSFVVGAELVADGGLTQL